MARSCWTRGVEVAELVAVLLVPGLALVALLAVVAVGFWAASAGFLRLLRSVG